MAERSVPTRRHEKWDRRVFLQTMIGVFSALMGLVLAILVFGPLATGAVRTRSFLIIQGLTIGVLLLWGARFWAVRWVVLRCC